MVSVMRRPKCMGGADEKCGCAVRDVLSGEEVLSGRLNICAGRIRALMDCADEVRSAFCLFSPRLAPAFLETYP